jgi:hypothetical protein
MKRRPARTKTKTTKKAPAPAPPTPPETTLEAEAHAKADQYAPAPHDPRLVAEVAARLARGQNVTRADGARLAQSALNLLDGVRDVVQRRGENRSGIIQGYLVRAEIPEHLGWAEGKKYILGTDGGGSEGRFGDLLKDKLRIDKFFLLRAQRLQAGLPEPELDEIPNTTARELNTVRSRLEKEGFSRSDLESLKHYYSVWRVTVDGRRKKN